MADFPRIPGYRIERELGSGGMATVYLAVQEKLGREVAVKVLSPLLQIDRQFLSRFLKEAETAARLHHAHIIPIYDVGQEGDYNFIVMEYLEGSLREKLKSGPLDIEDALRILRQMAGALNYARTRGFVHRDIKPENIMFRHDGSAVLVDFGIAKAVDSTTKLTRTGISIGTPHYMSPEQARGEDLDGRADIYALGVVFYEMLTGDVPFDAEDSVAIAIKHLQEPIPRLSRHLAKFQTFLDCMLAKNKEERLRNGDDIMMLVEELAYRDDSFRPAVRLEAVPVNRLETIDNKQDIRMEGTKKDIETRMPPKEKAGKQGSYSKKPRARTRKGTLAVLIVLFFVTAGLLASTILKNNRSRDEGYRSYYARALDSYNKKNYGNAEAYVKIALQRKTELEAVLLLERIQKERVAYESRQRKRRADYSTWKTATQSNTLAAYQDYLDRYPYGKYRQDAKKRMDIIQNENLQAGQTWMESSTGMEFVWIPAGEFMMGSDSGDADEKPIHRIAVSGFWLGKHEVTQGVWEAVMGSNPAFNQRGASFPVEQVSWSAIEEFIIKLSEKTGLEFRLPTEAEWEYACRAGGDEQLYGNPDDIAWHYGNANNETHTVGQKNPNAWGLYDILGNVLEWCQDWYVYGFYQNSSVNDPYGPETGSTKTLRGGSWMDEKISPTIRYAKIQSYSLNYTGFRLVKSR